MSVDTYLKRKNLAPYTPVDCDGVQVLIPAPLARWAKSVRLDVRQFLVWKSFDIEAEPRHEHGPSCAH